MMRAAEAKGAKLRLGRVTGVVCGSSCAGVNGVQVGGEIIGGDAAVIAMGPWSILAAGWLPLPGVFGLKGHSLGWYLCPGLKYEAATLEYEAATFEDEEGPGAVYAPEVFPRADGTHLCLRHLQRKPAAGRPRRCRTRSGRGRAPAGALTR